MGSNFIQHKWSCQELRGDRLGFQLLRGSGPSEGYVSTKIKGKEQNGSFDRLLFESSYMGVSKNRGTPKSSILIGFSIINHPFWGTPIFGNTHIGEL